jgi:hypothetical protein
MSSPSQPGHHYLSPTMFLAYGWAYGFTVFAALVGLSATRLWLAQLTWPAVVLGYGALFAFLVGLRPVLLDLTADLGIREKVGIFVLIVAIFASPKLATPRATLIDCLIVLQFPLAVLLLRRENFMRLYAANFMLVALSVFVEWQTGGGGFEWAAWLPVFVVGCFAADRFFLELDRYPNIEARPFFRPLLLGLGYAAVSLAGGFVLYLLTPDLALARPATTAQPLVEQRGGAQTVSFDALYELVWDTLILMILIVAALVVIQWLKRKYRRTEVEAERAMGGGVMRMVRKIMRATPRPPQMERGFSPREQIMRGYWSWCDELERFGLVRVPAATPREFARTIAGNNQTVAAPVAEATALFEWAKYDRRELTRTDADRFFAHSRSVIETLLQSAKAR